MRECILEQIRCVLPKEHGIGHARFRHCSRVKERRSDLVLLNKLEHAREEETLQLETTLMVRVSEDEEYVLYDAEEILLEECVGDSRLCAGEIVDDFQTY